LTTYPQLRGARDHTFVWALLLSIALHVFAMTKLPGIHLKDVPKPKIIEVQLAPQVQPKAIESEPAPPAPAPEPEPPKPKPIPKPQPKPKPLPAPKPEPVQEPEPAPIVEAPAPTEAPEPQPAPPVMTTAPSETEPPTFTTPPPPPAPPEPRGPSQQDLDAARDRYGSLLAREIAKHKRYPRIAQMRGWEGEAAIELQLDGSGKILASKIKKSSGYEVLDKQALEMVERATPFPPPPAVLSGQSFTLLVPISFRLE
jgi:protein TonB